MQNSTDSTRAACSPQAGSRLDSFIRRLNAQRDVLNMLCDRIGPNGPVLELGLGNGRTYDHLRHRLPGRRIIAFDRTLAASLFSTPPEADLMLGEIREVASSFEGVKAALLHVDIGTGYDVQDAETLGWLPGLVCTLVAPGGLVASGLPLAAQHLISLPLPPGISEGRYFVYRRDDR